MGRPNPYGVIGLSLQQTKWIFRFISPVTGKRRDMGLGAYPDVPLRIARKRARAARLLVLEGYDPINHRGQL